MRNADPQVLTIPLIEALSGAGDHPLLVTLVEWEAYLSVEERRCAVEVLTIDRAGGASNPFPRLATSLTHARVGVIPHSRCPSLPPRGWEQRDNILSNETTAGDLKPTSLLMTSPRPAGSAGLVEFGDSSHY